MRAMVGAVSGVEGRAPADPGPMLPGHSAKGPALRGPALVVLGIAVVIVVVGLVGAALAPGSGAPARPSLLRQVTLSDGSTLPMTPGSTALHDIVSGGQPPSDVVGPLAVPAGSTPAGTVDEDLTTGSYDRTAEFTTTLAAGEVVDAYRTLLPRLGWHVIYSGAGMKNGRPGTEVLAERAGSDGNEWEVGVVVSPGTAAGVTPFSLELLIAADDG